MCGFQRNNDFVAFLCSYWPVLQKAWYVSDSRGVDPLKAISHSAEKQYLAVCNAGLRLLTSQIVSVYFRLTPV